MNKRNKRNVENEKLKQFGFENVYEENIRKMHEKQKIRYEILQDIQNVLDNESCIYSEFYMPKEALKITIERMKINV